MSVEDRFADLQRKPLPSAEHVATGPPPAPRYPAAPSDVPSLVGREARGPRPFPLGALFFALIAASLVAIAVALRSPPHPVIFAVFPALLAVFFYLGRRPAFVARFTEEAVELDYPRFTLPYERIEEVTGRERLIAADFSPDSYPIHVLHADGYLTIPASLSIPSDDIFLYLSSRQGAGKMPRTVSPRLKDYFRRQEERYGPSEVMVYRPRKGFKPPRAARNGRNFGLAAMATGLVWGAIGAVSPGWHEWMAAGIVLFIVGGFFYFLFWLLGRRGVTAVKDWQKACLIVGPDGLALVQGSLCGELRWDELRGVKVRKRPPALTYQGVGQSGGIELVVPGARIFIADIYHRPLAEIEACIHRHWRGSGR